MTWAAIFLMLFLLFVILYGISFAVWVKDHGGIKKARDATRQRLGKEPKK